MDSYGVSKSVNIARWVARGIALVYLPFALYMWLLSAVVVLQGFTGMLGIIYAATLLAISALAAGYILLMWYEVLAGWLVLCGAVLLVIVELPVIWDWHSLAYMLKWNFLPIILKLLLLVLPVLILYLCRRAQRQAVEKTA